MSTLARGGAHRGRHVRALQHGARARPDRGSPEPGAHSLPRATCSLRAVRAEARARSSLSENCAPARRCHPAPTPPGFGRQGAGVGAPGS